MLKLDTLERNDLECCHVCQNLLLIQAECIVELSQLAGQYGISLVPGVSRGRSGHSLFPAQPPAYLKRSRLRRLKHARTHSQGQVGKYAVRHHTTDRFSLCTVY